MPNNADVSSPDEIMTAIVQAVERAAARGPEHTVPMEMSLEPDMNLMPFLFNLLENGIRASSITAKRRSIVFQLKKMHPRDLERSGQHYAYFAFLVAGLLFAEKGHVK
jgi:hypothetical protein